MNDESDRTFIAGNRNPKSFGWSIRACNSCELDGEQVTIAAKLLGREAFFKDECGYEHEIFAATVHADGKRIVYLESRAKEKCDFVDIDIKIHYVDADGRDRAIDIQSYNPFFGCDVALLEWFDDQVAILIYREKHWTFIYRIGAEWPPKYVKIEDRWRIDEDILSFLAYKAETVQRLQLPTLNALPPLAMQEAKALGQVPPDPY